MVVHVGSNGSENIHLETLGRQYGYSNPDRNSICPAQFACSFGKELTILSKINIKEILKNNSQGKYKIKESRNPGSTLNEYTYYVSLCNDPGKTISITFP